MTFWPSADAVPWRRHTFLLQTAQQDVADGSNEHAIIDELKDDVCVFADKGHVVISAPRDDEPTKNIWTIDAEAEVPWGETVLDIIAAMEGVVFVIHAAGDTIVSGEIDIFATRALPVTDSRYISGRLRADRIVEDHRPHGDRYLPCRG